MSDKPDLKVRVFAVWEPILATDVSKPIGMVLSRITDPRVEQFWDPDHVLATRMAHDARSPQPTQKCCVQDGHLWDLVAVYSAGVTWDAQIPIATVFDGPVLYVDEQIRQAVTSNE